MAVAGAAGVGVGESLGAAICAGAVEVGAGVGAGVAAGAAAGVGVGAGLGLAAGAALGGSVGVGVGGVVRPRGDGDHRGRGVHGPVVGRRRGGVRHLVQGEHLEDMFGGMITPYPGVHALALFLGCAWFADERRTENTVTAVEPAVRTPGEGVQCLVRVSVVIPAVEENLRIARGFRRVAVLDWNEHEVGRGAYPYAAEAELQSADQIQVIEEHRAPIEFAVAVGVFEDQDAVVAAENVLELFG